MSSEKIQQRVTDKVVEQLEEICPNCNATNLEDDQILCKNDIPPHMIYTARLAGTHDNDSDDLVALLEQWAVNGLNITLNKDISPSHPQPLPMMNLVGSAAGIVVGLLTLVVTVGAFVACQRLCRATSKTNKPEQ